MFSKLLLSILCVLFFFLFEVGEVTGQNQFQKHHDRLKRLRDEIEQYEKDISANKKKEKSVLNYLANLDLEIDLTQSLVLKLRKEEREKTEQIRQLGERIKKTEEELEQLKAVFARRMVYFYKYGRVKDLELLLTTRSINQGLLWMEYQKRLADHDYRNYREIKDKQAQLIRDKDLRTLELAEKQKIIKQKIQEEKDLKSKKGKRQNILKSIRQDTELLRQKLADKQKAAEEIRKIIFRLESTAEQTPLLKPDTPFPELKGKMLWPTRGKIVAKFGRFVHPQLRTVTENLGVDIQAPSGKTINAVASGKVTAITWQRGRGNIVIISHYGGYYTVYTHMQEIWVTQLQDVEMGQAIGTVGESGSLSGPMLHFEIWKGTEKLDPEDWLGS